MKYKYIDEKGEHMHTLDGKPLIGTSTVCGVLAKPLTWWAAGLAVSTLGWSNSKLEAPETRKMKAGEALSMIKDLDATSYLELLDKAYKAHAEKKDLAAESGTDMHSLLEAYVKKCIAENKGVPIDYESEDDHIKEIVKWSVENVKRFILSEFNVFSSEMWTGGVSDVMFEMKDGKVLIGDFKSSKEAYLSQFIQIAGYDIQLDENGAYLPTGEQIADRRSVDGYVVFPFGAKKFEPTFRFNTEELRAGFRSALCLYKLSN